MSGRKAGPPESAAHVLQIRATQDLPSHKTAAQLDDLDRDILHKHQKDVFFSYVELAKKWDVTAATIRNRIKRLKAAGVMDVILVLNPYKIGYPAFAVIGIRLETSADPEPIASRLLSFPGVIGLVRVAGRYDFFAQCVCQNMEEYRKFVSDKVSKIAGIASIESFIGLDLYERKFELGVIR
jgi:Lrp/AsnC family transcriptional regulator for asnA, asnC and gidA